ncbi:hypothetical protein EC2016001_3646 [Escherichia coli 201600.1]|nr:hypothetical protein EC2016001_3646 [Escherichia coli 201600.1]
MVVRRFEENKNGLSPLARGTRLNGNRHGLSWRFIPAGAGNSPASLEYPLYIPVYPRWRGELAVDFAGVVSAGGLSPLARGTRTRDAPRFVGTRFIPAGAGNSHHDARATRQGSVYPRWRGELARRQFSGRFVLGLSPLARGTLPARLRSPSSDRFIPAGAGNSNRLFVFPIFMTVYPRWRGELM